MGWLAFEVVDQNNDVVDTHTNNDEDDDEGDVGERHTKQGGQAKACYFRQQDCQHCAVPEHKARLSEGLAA